MAPLFWIVWLLGVIDLAATTWGLQRGVVREVNPLMADLFARGHLAAWAVGLLLPAAGLFLLWRVFKRHPRAVWVLWGLFVVRLGIVLMHGSLIGDYLNHRRRMH